jgi:hypothetical protein
VTVNYHGKKFWNIGLRWLYGPREGSIDREREREQAWTARVIVNNILFYIGLISAEG